MAYHDRSDGGLWATICEMAFASRTGLDLHIDALGAEPFGALFNEELGAVIQIRTADRDLWLEILDAHHIRSLAHPIGGLRTDGAVCVHHQGQVILQQPLLSLYDHWIETSHRIAALRDNPVCADQERATHLDADNTGLHATLQFNVQPTQIAAGTERPKIAILREQGVNGQVEMAAAFDRAGFEAIDVHMTDLRSGRVSLQTFKGLVACGGFSWRCAGRWRRLGEVCTVQ